MLERKRVAVKGKISGKKLLLTSDDDCNTRGDLKKERKRERERETLTNRKLLHPSVRLIERRFLTIRHHVS